MLSLVNYVKMSYGLTSVIQNSLSVGIGVIFPFFRPKWIELKNGLFFKNRGKNSDLFILKEVFFDQLYSPPFFSIGTHDVVVDIGGQMGAFSIYASQYTKNKIYSFEPFDENYLLFEENVQKNSIVNICIEKYGLGDSKKEIDLYIHPKNSGGHSIYHKSEMPQQVQKKSILLDRFDDFFQRNGLERIDFMKIDCEGAEYDIILNMNHQVLSKVVKIAMEIETFGDKKPETIIQFLEANGFKCAQMGGSLFAINTKYL